MNLQDVEISQAKSLVNAPLRTALTNAGITFKEVPQSGVTYYRLENCPICSGARSRPHKFECSFSEASAENGRYHRAFKCFDGGNEDQNFYWEAMQSLGLLSSNQVQFLTNSRAITPSPKPKKLEPVVKPKKVREFSLEWATRLHRNLLSNPAAMGYLASRGWSEAAIIHFKLGLSLEAKTTNSSTGETYKNHSYLTHPVKGIDGNFIGQYPFHRIPGVTLEENPARGKTFCSGSTNAYFSAKHDGQQYLVVCDGMKDLWSVWQALRGTEFEEKFLVVSSTHGGGNVPESLREGFFNQFEKVYMAHDNDKPGKDKHGAPLAPAGDMHAIRWAKYAPTNAYRVKPEGSIKDWNDFFQAGNKLGDFLALLKAARTMSSADLVDDATIKSGRQAYSPVAIEGEYHNGFLYYVTEVMVTSEPLPGHVEKTVHVETIAVRSDGTEHRARQLPKPEGIKSKPVWQLFPDGAIISGPLKPNPYATWRFDSIERYRQAAREGKRVAPALVNMLQRVERHLRATTLLPVELDYAILATAVVASYCQRIFDAVPLLLLTGPAGTGKSQLGKAMSDLSANSPKVTGMPTAASIARQIHESKGFITIDDLESIGQGNKDSEFGDLVQSLKVSYNKATATKTVTNVKKDFAVEHLDFFGIKLINNTSGVGHILGTRMFKIMTRAMPAGAQLPKGLLLPEEIVQLRNDLHTWVFENVSEIAQTYQAIFPSKSTRSEEISAPLRVVATLTGDDTLLFRLNEALGRQSGLKIEFDTPEDLVDEALKRIIKRSIQDTGEIPLAVSVTQLQLELALLVDIETYGKDSTTQLSVLQKPEWVGRVIMATYAEAGTKQIRSSLFSGKSVRAYQLRSDFVSEVISEFLKEAGNTAETQPDFPQTMEFKGFCQMCDQCFYADRCDFREEKEAYMAGLKNKRIPIKPVH